MYLWMTKLKGVSSMKLHRDLGITQKSASFMAHRLREAFSRRLSENRLFSKSLVCKLLIYKGLSFKKL